MKKTNDAVGGEHRDLSDRRKKHTNTFSFRAFRGRRKTIRRMEDRRRHPYTDQYGLRVFLVSILIVLLCGADALYTILHVSSGNAIELNPLMDELLKLGPYIFFVTKFTLTAFCVLMLVLYKHHPLGRILMGGVAAIYCVVISYQLFFYFF